MTVRALDHLQVAMPPGREAEARAFYTDLLSLAEIPKPTNLAGRGGCWFSLPPLQLHLGVEQDFAPARKAHPAFLVDDLPRLLTRLASAGHPARHDEKLAGYDRAFVNDPFGNRIELMEREPG